MRVARVSIHAPVTSFRHPFFVTGRQPTALFPPPSTVHGHCASACGFWPDASKFWFGLHFTFASRAQDLEHQHISSALPSRTKAHVSLPSGESVRATTEITVAPVARDFLYDAKLVLYLEPNLAAAFRAPVHTVVLGRSQDLAEIVEVTEVELAKPVRARIEHTLLPRHVRPAVRFGPTVLLSRHIGEPPRREATFAQYIALHEPVFFGDPSKGATFDRVEGMDLAGFWCDPTVVDEDGFARGIWLHTLID